ncbi:MAG: MOSC domain-containing protein [Gammaproteobacteria bacterium]|nr:MOSC domain-containing protein [Gammaproteobacteria bacterium]MBU2678576.1 MOSC domain-containing protein [Gammaproteobacteria bacterium]NNC57542.1 MOSC domain-containing protein [Woeseiaceae bacterium]NNL52310.1 MOSC domain-containing protein [Woeseiaceae bacterium]
MRITSVNVGRAETIAHENKIMTTGICKRQVPGPVEVTAMGLRGDQIMNGEHHGGIDQAVYAYSADDYEWWASDTGREFHAGLFGENLTISGLPSDMAIGDRLLIGDVVLEATSARIPCSTLATRMADRGFGQAFRKAERPGIYFRVLNPGIVASGDSVTMIEGGASSVTVLDLFRFAYETSHEAAKLRRFLEAPVAERVRAQIEKKLAKA